MAFVMAHKSKYRLKMVGEGGALEYDRRDPMDTSYLQLLDAEKAEDAEAVDIKKEAEEAAPSPWEALDKFTTAKVGARRVRSRVPRGGMVCHACNPTAICGLC
jgi:hypothetical protein